MTKSLETMKIEEALRIATQSGGCSGSHHKAWVIDQMVRVLTDCPQISTTAKDVRGSYYTYMCLGESDAYQKFVIEHNAGEDGPDTYDWDIGIPP